MGRVRCEASVEHHEEEIKVRSRQQTIAIILSKFKRKQSGRSFAMMDRPTVRDATGPWQHKPGEYAKRITSGDVSAGFQVKNGIAQFGTIRINEPVPEWGVPVEPEDDLQVGRMYRGQRTPSESPDVVTNHVQRVMREFVRQVLADPDIHEINTRPVNPKIEKLLRRYGAVTHPDDADFLLIDVDEQRERLQRFVGDRPRKPRT
jgi:hypothetical protein